MRGDICKTKDASYSWRLCSNGKEDTEAAVYIAEVMIDGQFVNRKFTVKTYKGPNAKKVGIVIIQKLLFIELTICLIGVEGRFEAMFQGLAWVHYLLYFIIQKTLRLLYRNIPLFGYNKTSSVPLLIFHGGMYYSEEA